MLTGGIKTAHNKSLKKSYKHLDGQEKRLVKINERYEIANTFLYGRKGFYSTVKRSSNNTVDWDSVDESLMASFTHATKEIEKYHKQDELLMESAVVKFNQTQFRFGQSF